MPDMGGEWDPVSTRGVTVPGVWVGEVGLATSRASSASALWDSFLCLGGFQGYLHSESLGVPFCGFCFMGLEAFSFFPGKHGGSFPILEFFC